MSDGTETNNGMETLTESELISAAQQAISSCNWVVGECAAEWTQKYAAGRTDGDFARLVGLSPDQIYQRRRVWETFSDVRDEYTDLKWSHFYVALNWDEAAEALQWATENEATVQEMRAWRKAVRGEDLDAAPAPDDFSGDTSISWVPTEAVPVRDVDGQVIAAGDRSGSGGDGRSPATTVAIAARDTSEGGPEYAPFSGGAVTPPRTTVVEESPQHVKPAVSDEQILKKIVSAMDKMNADLTPERVKKLSDMPQKAQDKLIKAVSEINTKIAGLL